MGVHSTGWKEEGQTVEQDGEGRERKSSAGSYLRRKSSALKVSDLSAFALLQRMTQGRV